jgi:holin-like protein
MRHNKVVTGRPEASVTRTPWIAAQARLLCRLVFQTAFLFLLFRAGEWGVAWLRLPLPGNVLGMLLLFGLLSLGLVRESWIQEGTTLLTKHLAFFFIPIAVGLMEWGALFRREGHWLLLALVVSTLTTLLTAGGLAALIDRHVLRKGADRWETPGTSLSPSSSPSVSMR